MGFEPMRPGYGPTPLAAVPDRPGSGTSPYCSRDSNPDCARPERAASYRWARAALEWATGFEPALPAWQDGVLPLTLRPPGASGRIRTGTLACTRGVSPPSGPRRPALGTQDSNLHERIVSRSKAGRVAVTPVPTVIGEPPVWV